MFLDQQGATRQQNAGGGIIEESRAEEVHEASYAFCASNQGKVGATRPKSLGGNFRIWRGSSTEK